MRKLTVLLVTALVFLGAGGAYARDMLEIKGSDTLINLVQKLAEEYMSKNYTAIAVTGGGSGTGIAALINGKCDIADASRTIKSKEVDSASANGIDVRRVVVAIDGLSFIVNKNNSVNRLTMDQLGKIFAGEITNWREVGGADKAITLYGRQSNSGTYDFVKEVVIEGDYSSRMNQMNGNAQIVEAVKSDGSGIGYVGIGYIRGAAGITALKVARSASSEYASPLDTLKVKSGEYPVSRPLNQYVNGTPKGKVKDFIQFELSPEGQKIVEDEGFFAISKEYEELNKKTLGM